ncbi:MAG TPA: 7TM diverse intracellular signaling domain-containing protein [Flavipsychrobacter sp.]|nr:7TM diverse intracellular signaling domain-containing protein [Flavipsychrobacter sp.]
MVYRLILLLLVIFTTGVKSTAAPARDSVIEFQGLFSEIIGDRSFLLLDSSNKMNLQDVLRSNQFVQSDKKVPNLGTNNGTVWVKFSIKNISPFHYFSLEVENAFLDNVILFYPDSASNSYKQEEVSKAVSYNTRKTRTSAPLFTLHIPKGQMYTFYLKIRSEAQLLIPMKFGTEAGIARYDLDKRFLRGIYFGIILGLFLYNVFIYFSTRDKAYLYYLLYIFSVCLVQLNITGLGYKYVWPNFPNFEKYSLYIFPTLTAIGSIGFARQFLQLKERLPRINKVFSVIVALYVVLTLNAFWGDRSISYNLINFLGLPLALLLIYVGIHMGLRYRTRASLVFLLAWTIFLLSVVVFVLKDFSALPYNLFTISVLQIGSAIVVILLSLALADKINALQEETEKAQEQALAASRENERILSEQKVILEKEVDLRTKELQDSNQSLQQALIDLKEAESQLVESEKMASLGQLTAGIAHEINNPINFVTSNVTPLRRDILILQDVLSAIEKIGFEEIPDNDKLAKIKKVKNTADYDYLLKEIEYLLKGIEEGANRTSEIVKGLRVFSRLDENDIKRADLNEGLDSTLVIVNNMLDGKISIDKNYGTLPMVECYPGKLNQVFMNIISNGIHAVRDKWGGETGGKIVITTSHTDEDVSISIKDNGAGMTETTKKKLFEPFFTTKEVGVGTGLGLSIAWNTIKKHNGTIKVNSEIGEGAEFIITLPINHIETIEK